MEVDHVTTDLEQAGGSAFDAFLQTGRTGRRNALADIMEQNATISTASLPGSLEKLSCSDVPTQGTSKNTSSGEDMDTSNQPSTSDAGRISKSQQVAA
ncbi:uncharacterized protein LOC111618840 [Centruroides sculpturatus]|uniref:uncharacterized protein LOC111618840 n=1 Tax=Centruroides sculpturatus TaxID=218467 RepID=UPI000C6E9930|nr:uncharacterized protein LOC111618840 [Centruroides sculpturatus]